MKTRRTRRYNSIGQRTYTTLNKTSKQVSYSNTNPQFVMTCKARSNGGGKGCTNAGCGSQCCQLSFLVSDISYNVWMDISGIRPGQTLKNSGGHGTIGTIKEIVFPCACCQDIDLIGNNEYDNFPLNMRILAKPASGSCANSGYTGGNLWTAQARDIIGDPTIEEAYEVMGTSNVGAPYRNPIKGWRKTLDCCPCENFIVTGSFSQTPNTSTLIGGVLSNDNAPDSWIIEGYSYIPGTAFDYTLTLQNNHCSNPPEAGETQYKISGQSSNLYYTIHAVEEITGRSRLVADDIYKDNYSGPKSSKSGCCPGNGQATSGIQARTQRPIIRSGMQPKPTICCKTGKTTGAKCNTADNCITKNNYSYDYHQYLHNRSLKSFKRSEDKFFTMYPDGNGTVQATLGGYCSQPAYGHGCNSINNIPMIYTKGTCREGHHCVATVGKINPTIYKPNNRKFSKQGAVTSSGRLERLKLNTIRAANSKCPKDQRCRKIVARNGPNTTKTYLSPKGPYFAGEPRFTGWMYNARHPERVCMLRYRQQPFGIPQLTNKQRATRSNRPVHYPDTYVTMIGLRSAFPWLTPPTVAGDPPHLWHTTPEVGDCIIQLQKPADDVPCIDPNARFEPPPGSPNFNPNGQNLNWLNPLNPSTTRAYGTIVSVDNGLSPPPLTIKVTHGSFAKPTPGAKSADIIECTDAALYTMIVGETTTCPPAPIDGPQQWSQDISGHYPRPTTTAHPNVRLYQTTGWTLSETFSLIATWDPTPTRGNIGIWQRGRSNPRAPACKCVPQGATGCPGAKCDKHCGIGQLAQNPGSPCCK